MLNVIPAKAGILYNIYPKEGLICETSEINPSFLKFFKCHILSVLICIFEHDNDSLNYC